MSRERDEINRVRNSIAGIVYNDCLPTSLITHSLKEICLQYDNFVNADIASEKGGANEQKRDEALKAIRASVDLINKQSISSGSGRSIFILRNGETNMANASLDDMRDLGETIAVIYALPYRAKTNLDYVGYAYGIAAPQLRNQQAYNTYKTDEYINACNIAVLENCDEVDARAIMQCVSDCASAFDYYKSVVSGEISGSEAVAENMISMRFDKLDSELLDATGVKPERFPTVIAARTIAVAMNAGIRFGAPSAIEELRDDNVFQDTQAMNNMLTM